MIYITKWGDDLKKVKKGVYTVPCVLSESLQQQELVLKEIIIQAQEKIGAFTKRYDFLS